VTYSSSEKLMVMCLMITACMAGSGNFGECFRLSQPSWLWGRFTLNYLCKYTGYWVSW